MGVKSNYSMAPNVLVNIRVLKMSATILALISIYLCDCSYVG